jgi:dihydroneopterin aldolase/2-amino-4-hydroxy-6-hydroxymethyldihydropteridine diphosphokinase
LAAFALLTELHGIEAEHGRVRETRWGARTLDLDLIQYGDPGSDSDLVSEDPEMMLPHPRAHERVFVLAPWAAIDAQAELRVGQALVPVSELLERADDAESAGIRPGPGWSPSW